MAEKKKEPEKVQANLSIQQMREALPKIDRRLDELNNFDVASVTKYGDAKVSAIEQKLDSFLVSTFGSGTVEYDRYRWIAHIMPMSFWPDMTTYDVQKGVSEGLESSKSQLEGMKSLFLEEIENQPEDVFVAEVVSTVTASTDVFIVHGHDDNLKNQVARLIEGLGLRAIILHEQPNGGKTVIEKFEEHSAKAGFAIALLTPDDIGSVASKPESQSTRARQNVILEQGYFFGKLGRARVCALYIEGVELPSDLSGILYIKKDEAGTWKYQIAREMKAAGLPIDLNLVQ